MMNFESGFSPTVSVEDSEEIRGVSNSGENIVHNNGSCDVRNSDYHELFSDVGEKGTEASDSVSLSPGELKSQVRKGHGLKKWRRIRRDVSKVGESSVNTVKIVTEELPSPSANPSKRAQVYAEREQKSEGSLLSRIPVVGNPGVFHPFGDHSLATGASVDVGTDLENSEDGSSKSSTAASVPIVKHDIRVAVGFPHDNKYMMSGKKLAQKGQVKKTRGERIKPDKETSISSNYARSNGIGSERPVHHSGENGDEVKGGRENGGYQHISTQDVIADLSPRVQKEKMENHDSSLDQDPLVESIYGLKTAQEALEKEVLKLKEVGKDITVDDSISDPQPEITQSSEQSPSGDKQSFSWAVHPMMLEIAKRDAEREIEDLFKQRIEAEVEYLTISRTVQKMKVPLADQITCVEEHTKLVSEKAKMLTKEAEKLKNCREDIASSDEAAKLQKKVCKYTSYFLVQLLSLLRRVVSSSEQMESIQRFSHRLLPIAFKTISRTPILIRPFSGPRGPVFRPINVSPRKARLPPRVGWILGMPEKKKNALPDIVKAGDPVLHEPAQEVKPDEIESERIQKIIDDMVKVMRRAPGVGLAAPQIGIPLRIIVLEDKKEYMSYVTKQEIKEQDRRPFDLLVVINPVLKKKGSRTALFFEGCLSVDKFRAVVERDLEVEVTGLDRDGRAIKVEASGWQARIFQHECDHLDGTLYVDKMVPRTFRTEANLDLPLAVGCPKLGVR